MEAIDHRAQPVQSLEWGVLKWLVSPDGTEGAGLTFGEVLLLPGKGHDRHNHPESEEVLYVLSGYARQMLDDGEERWFDIGPGDTIYVPQAMYHATINNGWQPIRLLAIYNPGGAERVLRDLPGFGEGDGPEWTLSDELAGS